MMNDLLKLKEELEMARKYVPLIWNNEYNVLIASDEEGRTLLEYATMENTSEIVRQCEELIKEAVVLLGRNNIPYDIIVPTSYAGLLCTPELVELLKNKLEKSNEDKLVNFNQIALNNIGTNISLKYVPVEFNISPYDSGIFTRNKDLLCLRRYLGQDYVPKVKEITDIQNLFEKRIFGIVDFEKFRAEIRSLDYEFGVWNVGVIKDYGNDYAKALKKGLLDTSLGIMADFRPLELKRKIR